MIATAGRGDRDGAVNDADPQPGTPSPFAAKHESTYYFEQGHLVIVGARGSSCSCGHRCYFPQRILNDPAIVCVACGRPTVDPHDDHHPWCPNHGPRGVTADCTCHLPMCDGCCSCKETNHAT